jgi:acyl-CoA synthetase (AMP-forming)/AMP-acid ligase II
MTSQLNVGETVALKRPIGAGGTSRLDVPWRSVSELMCERAQICPDHPYTRFDPQTGDADLSYGQAWALACRWAELFDTLGVAPGKPVLLALPNGADFVGAFFGATLAGLVPAPSIPRRSAKTEGFLSNLAERADRVEAGVVVLPNDQREQALVGRAPVVTPLSLSQTARDRSPGTRGDLLGLLQFTSGTSGRSKAVQLSQDALLFQGVAITRALGVRPEDLGLSWLPLYHDMGLLGFLITSAAAGCSVYLLRTEAFISRPTIWMEAVSRERATITSAPPSAYALAARLARPNARRPLDLSSLRIAIMGAERITRGALEAVRNNLVPVGFSWGALVPAYGMAEVGVAVTMVPTGRGAAWETVDTVRLQRDGEARRITGEGQDVVGCGFPLERTEIRIVDNSGRTVPERRVGQVLVRCPSLMLGYIGGGGAQHGHMGVRDGWLNTGDQGYVSGSELYVTGRIHDLLNVGGNKYMPEEFEEAAQALEGVRVGRVVAVGRENEAVGTESVVLLVETAIADLAARDKFALEIRQALTRRSLPIGDVVFVPPKTIQLTPNGKLPRAQYKARLLAGEFQLGQS